VRARGHFPNERAALKCVYLAVMSLDPTGKGRKRWVTRWFGSIGVAWKTAGWCSRYVRLGGTRGPR
jgi:hypothetical protein